MFFTLLQLSFSVVAANQNTGSHRYSRQIALFWGGACLRMLSGEKP